MPKLPRVAPALALNEVRLAKMARRFCGFALFLMAACALILPTPASAQRKYFAHDDVALSGSYVVGTSVTGTIPGSVPPNSQTEKPSTSGAIMFTGRYTRSKFIGFEGNFSFTRLDEDFSGIAPGTKQQFLIGGAQSTIEEFSLGYIAHAPTMFGVVPFAGAGIGVLSFEPTPYGGQSLPPQARMEYYGTIGADAAITPHFGVRAQFRDLIYKAPDYGQNYLTTGKRTQTFEPTIGFYLRF